MYNMYIAFSRFMLSKEIGPVDVSGVCVCEERVSVSPHGGTGGQ